jgi:hypothetical protein
MLGSRPDRVTNPPTEDLPQVAGLGGHHLQRFAVDPGRFQPEIEGGLGLGQPLAGCGLEGFDLGVVVGGAQMVNLARTTPRRPRPAPRSPPEVVFTVRT